MLYHTTCMHNYLIQKTLINNIIEFQLSKALYDDSPSHEIDICVIWDYLEIKLHIKTILVFEER